jgi:drug/metabolite transporter (DMT)-like permease
VSDDRWPGTVAGAQRRGARDWRGRVRLRFATAGLAAGIVTVTLWASAFVAIRATRHVFSPGALALGRLLVAVVGLGVIMMLRREPLPSLRATPRMASYGVLWLGLYSVLLNQAERQLDAGTAAMLVNTGPLMIAVLAAAVLGEGLPRTLAAGSAAAFTGTVLIGVATSRAGSAATGAVALCLVAAAAYAVSTVVQKPALETHSPLQVTFIGVVAATVACLPFGGQLARELPRAAPGGIAAVVYLGLVVTAFSFVTWAFALRRMTAGRAGALFYLVPPFAIAIEWVVLAERPPTLALAGGGLCLAGVAWSRRAR